MTHRSTALVLFALPLTVLVGCGQSAPTPPSISMQAKLADIGGMYREYTKDHKRPPRQLSDLEHPYEPAHIDGYAALRDGECVMLWGGAAPGANAAATVLAYEKVVPEAGGLVVFQDGTVKPLTADEFKTAPKAK